MKTLFIIGHTFPESNTTAAGTRMMQLIELFQEMGYRIVFGSTAAKTEYSNPLDSIGLETLSIKLNDSSFNKQLGALSPDIVLFDRFMTEEQFGWRVRETCPDAMTILDTEDLHFLRKSREEAVLNNTEIDLYTPFAQRELASILRCDLNLIISEEEQLLLESIFNLPKGLLLYLPIYFSEELKGLDLKFEERIHFITLGNFLHRPNRDAIHWLKHALWPSIRKQLPLAECHIYGAYLPSEVKSWHDSSRGFLIKGWASDKEAVISKAKVMLAPLRFGAGLKGKVLDAFFYGTPVVTTGIGAEGIVGNLKYSSVCSMDDREITSKAIELYTVESEWQKVQLQGVRIVENRFLKKHFQSDFLSRIVQIGSDLGAHRKKHFLGQILHHESVQSKKFMSKWIELKNNS